VSSHHSPAGPASEHEIHLPGPSLSPPLLGLGVAVLAFFLVGLVTWLIDDARAYAKAPDEGHH
jgi:hypothetical protein